MNGIIGMTSLLLDTSLSPEQNHYTNTIRVSAESLLTIINDILDFSKMEAGKLDFEETPFLLTPLVEGVVDILAPRARAKGIDITFHVPRDGALAYVGDAGRLRQVLLNLAGNAVKFTEKGGVSVTVELLPLDQSTVEAVFKVADSGIGIVDDAKDRLFNRFTQADSSTARKFGGTGLGLAICQKIVEAFGGTIGFDSVAGQGSTFWFRFPLRRCEGAELPDDFGKALDGMNVLVVATDLDLRQSLCDRLVDWGAGTTCAGDALAGLGEARKTPFDVALIQADMPTMSGRDLVSILRADDSMAGLRLILLADDPGAFGADDRRRLGLSAVLDLPMRQSQLLDSLMPLAARQGGGAPTPQDTHGLRILVAEDNAINQQVAVGLLGKLGHRADVAHDGAQALALVQQCEYDLVLMDMQMPNMDGLTAARAIRALPGPVSTITIVAMTANAMDEDRNACLAAGMNDYISKPVDRQRLAAMLGKWGQRRVILPQTLPVVAESEPAADDDEPLVDQAAVEDLADALGEDYLNEVRAHFWAGLPSRVDEVLDAVGRGDWDKAAAAAHSIKGSAANLGYVRLAASAAAVETVCKQGDDNHRRLCAQALPKVVEATRAVA